MLMNINTLSGNKSSANKIIQKPFAKMSFDFLSLFSYTISKTKSHSSLLPIIVLECLENL